MTPPILSTPRRCRVDFLVPSAFFFRLPSTVFGVRVTTVSDGSITSLLAAVFSASSSSTVQSLMSFSSLSSSLYSTILGFAAFFACPIANFSFSALRLSFVGTLGPGMLIADSLGPGVLFPISLGPGCISGTCSDPGCTLRINP